MKKITNKRRLRRGMYAFLGIALAASFLLPQSCKKADSNQSSKGALGKHSMYRTDPSKTYSMAEYQQALDDVQLDENGHMVFNNMNHLDVVLSALDSLGDSTAISWENGLGFSSLKIQYINTLNAYAQLMNSPQTTQAQAQQFWAANSNVAVMSADNTDINATDEGLAWVLAGDHKAYIDDMVLYSDRNNFITLPTVNQSSIPNYMNLSNSINDSTHRLFAARSIWSAAPNQLCTTGLYLGTQTYNLNDIQCGSPLQKKTTVNCQVINGLVWATCGGSGYIREKVNIHNYKRGFLGFWYNDNRNVHVYGYFGPGVGVYYNFTAFSVNSYSFTVYNASYTCIPVWAVNMLVQYSYCFRNGAVCAFPMCNGSTLCDSY